MEKSILSYLFVEAEKDTSKKNILILFHGGESNNEALQPVTPYFGEARLVLPQGPLKVNENTFNWFNFIDGSLEIDKDSLKESIKTANQFIEEIRTKYPDESLYIGGLSQGAIFGYELFLDNPDHFAGLICLSGFFPEHDNYPSLSNKDIFVAHGESDPLISVQTAAQNAETLEKLGAKVAFGTYDMGHEICEEELRDVAKWMGKF